MITTKFNVYRFNNPANTTSENCLTKFLEKIKLTTSYEQFSRILEAYTKTDNNAKKIDTNLIKSGEYYIKSEFSRDSETTGQILKILHDKGITIIPEYVKTISNKNGYAVTVTKIKGAGKGELLDFDKYYHILTPEAKEKAMQDIELMAKLGLINPAILKDPKGLKIVPELPYRIVCEDWSDLKTTDDYLMLFNPNGSVSGVLNEANQRIFK